jgi:hypothetical protein
MPSTLAVDAESPTTRCANCGAGLAGPFCAQCGQRVRNQDPTLRDLAGEALQQTLDLDGKLLRSLRLLFTRPGFLSAELVAGRRASYVSPFRLYLVFSVIAFAVAAYTADRALVSAQGDVIDIGMGQRVFLSEADGPEERQRLVEHGRRLLALRTAWLPRVMFVLLPVAALVVMAVTRRSGRNYPQHFYFTLHLQAAVFAGMAIVALLPRRPPPAPSASGATVSFDGSPSALATAAIELAMFVYAVLAFRRAYGGGWFVNVARTAAVGAVQAALVIAALFAMLAVVIREMQDVTGVEVISCANCGAALAGR